VLGVVGRGDRWEWDDSAVVDLGDELEGNEGHRW
jgi:hypothetical protein